MIGLGCMRLSTDPARDPVRGRAVIAAAIEAGIGLLDTSDAYALDDTEVGHNERLIAGVLTEAPAGARVEVATKGGLVRPGGAWVAQGRARHLADAARASRDRLGVAALDLYLLHAIDPRTPLATSVRALARLRDDGIARAVGVSNVSLTQLEAALAITALDAIEVELSPWKLDAIRGGLVAACTARGIRVLAHRPLGGPPGVRRAMADPTLRALAARLGATPIELILAWLCTLSPMIVPLPGATQLTTVRSAARAAALVLDDDARTTLATRFLSIDGITPARTQRARTASTRPIAHDSRDAAPPMHSAHDSIDATPPTPIAHDSIDAAPPMHSAHDPVDTTPSRPSAHDPVDAAPTPPSAPDPVDAAPTPPSAPDPVDAASARPIAHDSRDAALTMHSVPESLDAAPPLPSASGAYAATPSIVVIVGMPASGKSTLAAEYAARGYLRLNRDEAGGTLIGVARALNRVLAGGARRIVIDNTYPSRASRAPVIEIARRHGASVHCVVLATSLEDAQSNAVARILARHGRLLMPGLGKDNELGRAGEIDPRAQFRYRRDYEPPRDDEGFATIEEVAFARAAAAGGRSALIVELDDIVWHKRPATPEAIELRPGARDALAAWAHGHALAGTTWQPGLASAAALEARLVELLGVAIPVMHCAHPPGPPVCWCRKPLPGLALALAHAHGLDLARSLHLGKGPADRGFAARAGMRYADIAQGWPAPG